MGKMGYGGIPILIYAHKDTDNNHVHVVTSRVGVDGKKINHDFEHRRSHEILNKILNIEPAQEYQKDISRAMAYQFGSVALLELLMERRRYSVKEKDDGIHFYKNGREQGLLSKEAVQSKISTEKPVEAY